jgi:predicted ATPase
LNVLRDMAAGQPLVVAVDDLPWLDPLSMSALSFAARRPNWRASAWRSTRPAAG